MSNISVSLLIAGQTERKTVDLPTGATVAQLKAKFNELNTGIFKDLTSGTVTPLTDASLLSNGSILSFSPTESRTTSSGVQIVSKKIVGNATDGIELIEVKVVKTTTFYEGTVPSVFTVADVLEQAGITAPCVFVNGQEIGYGTKVEAGMQIEVGNCNSTNLFETVAEEDSDDEDDDYDDDM